MYCETAEEKVSRGRKLQAATVKRGIGTRQLSEKIGCHINTIRRWYKDPNCITIAQADDLATILHMTRDEAYEIFFPGHVRMTE